MSNRFSKINIRSVNTGIASGNGVSNMQIIMTHLSLPIHASSYIEIVNNLVQISIQIAGEFIDKASINLVSMCRSDDENNEIYPENYKSDVKNYISVASVTINGTWQK